MTNLTDWIYQKLATYDKNLSTCKFQNAQNLHLPFHGSQWIGKFCPKSVNKNKKCIKNYAT